MPKNSSQLFWQVADHLETRSAPAPTRSGLLGLLSRHVLADRPAIAWSLALLFFFKGIVCLAVIMFPISSKEPIEVIGAVGILAILGASWLWVFATRISMLGFQMFAAGGSLIGSVLVANAATHGGMMLTAFSYPWIAIYSAHFFPRRGVILQGILISAGFGVGLMLGGLSHVVIYWVIVTVTIWSICLVLGHLSESLRRQADTDPLTGLLNRNGFLTAAMREHAIAARSGNPLTIAVLDLDGFKQINDLRGHVVGDRVLADLGHCWLQRLRAGDILARHGGDEFVLLLPATSQEGAGAVLDRLHADDLTVSWSVGISEWLPTETLGDCMARADSDLYEVKNALRIRAARVNGEALSAST